MKSHLIVFPVLQLLLITTCIRKTDHEVYRPEVGKGKYILTPKAGLAPEIHGPSVYGVRPGSPFLFTVPATGERPVIFSAENLPIGLHINSGTGIINGTIRDTIKTTYKVTLKASNQHGKAKKKLTIVVDDNICLSPPLGWNSWNCWKHAVTQEKVINSAKAMVDKGLQQCGWTYINIDDTWQGNRGGKFNAILPDTNKFPDIVGMCDTIHALGLKVGLYSTPWITSYAGYIGGSSDKADGTWDASMGTYEARKSKEYHRTGKYSFEKQDALQWAEWGIDYLKYDWYKNTMDETVRMAEALKNCGRDIVYSLSNTANIENAEKYAQIANCFRTAGDLKDRWNQEGPHLNIREQWEKHSYWLDNGYRGGAGHYPDPDMLVIGDVVTGSGSGKLKATRLTPDEQYSHISLWALWSAPMLIGCPIETMDDFTLGLLTNTEVLAVQQDEIGQAARTVVRTDSTEILVKEMSFGDKVVGLFNTGERARVLTVYWDDVGLKRKKFIRDIWRQENIGVYKDSFSAEVPSHGVILIRIF